jgi:plasmid maintenance system antidote protein VapI
LVSMTPHEAERLLGRRDRKWVAAQMGITHGYLNKVMTGFRPWTDDLQRRYAAAIGISVEALSFTQNDQG